MTDVIAQHLDVWTSALINKSTAGRGTSDKQTAYGIKKLRELILELAVRGKLVPQDPNDEPANVLLEKISKEKASLVNEGKIKKQISLPEISEDEKSFRLPAGWEWVRLNDISSYIQRGKGPKYADQGQVRVISQKCIQWNGFDLLQAKYVDDDSITNYQPERFLEKNDLLWNSTGTGTVGRISVLDEVKPNSLVADSHVTVIRPIKINSNFIWCYVAAPGIQLRIEPGSEKALVSGTTNQVELNTSEVVRLIVPIPPINEQHRIVAKVDELMALCDQLEQQQTDSITAHQTLVKTLLDTLTQAADAAEFEQAWSRIADYFDTLFTTEASIDQLKQILLQLAVLGKLVPQDSSDESAKITLQKIINEKELLIKAKKFQNTSKLKPKNNSLSFPQSWVYVQIGEVCPSIVPNRDKPKSFGGSIPWVTLASFPENGFYLDHSSIELGLTAGEVEMYSARLIPENTVLMSCVGRFGLTAINKVPVVPNQQIHAFVVLQGLIPEFLSIVIKIAANQLEDIATTTTIPYLNKTNCESIEFGLPPTAEQQRIVAKVDELMALCYSLKARIAAAQTIQLQLADAIVEQAVA